MVYEVPEKVREKETAQEVKETRRRGERETKKHSMVANNFTAKEQQKRRTSGSSGTDRSGVVFEPRQPDKGAEASHVERAATSFGESESGLATHGACPCTKVVEMEADLMDNKADVTI
jgi:hypothetical protein